MAEEVERSRRALRMEWKLIRGRKEKLAWRTPCMFGTRLPCSGIHACQSPPIVVLGNGGPGHRCACPPAPSASHWRSSICWPPAPGAHHSTSHWQPSICWQLTFHIIFVAGKLLYGLCRRRSRCTFTHCMFSRNVFLPPASRPVHRRPLLFWPPAPVDLLLKVVAHNCCP